MNSEVLAEKDGYMIRLAKAKDAEAYYEQNYCPLDREAVMDGDQYADDILMAILETEWRRIKTGRDR